MALDKNGHEVLDRTPVAVPLKFKRAETLVEQVRAVIRSEAVRAAAEDAGFESFREADDFDVGDDFDPTSPWELAADQEDFDGVVYVPPDQLKPKEAPVEPKTPVETESTTDGQS